MESKFHNIRFYQVRHYDNHNDKLQGLSFRIKIIETIIYKNLIFYFLLL